MENVNTFNISMVNSVHKASVPALHQTLYNALREAEEALENENSILAEDALNVVAMRVVEANDHSLNQCFKTLVNFKNPVICQRFCLALIQAACEKMHQHQTRAFLAQFHEIFPKLNVSVSREEMLEAWGVNSMATFGHQVLDVDGQEDLIGHTCWPLCRQVGLALFEWCQQASDHYFPIINSIASPSKEHALRVKDVLKEFSFESLERITSVKDFDSFIDEIIGRLIPSGNDKVLESSGGVQKQVQQICAVMQTAAGLLSIEMLKLSTFQKIDPSSNLNLYEITDYLSRAKMMIDLMNGEEGLFAAFYLMDELDSVLQTVSSGGLISTVGVQLFREIALRTYQIMKVEPPGCLQELNNGLTICKVAPASSAFCGLPYEDRLQKHIFLQIQASYIDWILNSAASEAHMKMGWDGHFMWGVIRNWKDPSEWESAQSRRWQMTAINTGVGKYLHHYKPDPSGEGRVYALAKVSRVMNTEEMRNYLTVSTQFQLIKALDKYMQQHRLLDTPEERLRVVLSANYDGLGNGGNNGIYTKGQRSITCVTKGCKGIIRSEDPGRYALFHLLSKMLVFTTYYKRIEALGHAKPLENEMRRTLSKQLFFMLQKHGARVQLLEEVARHFINDQSKPWLCFPVLKSIYTQHLSRSDIFSAKQWLKYIYQNDLALGIQCSAETIDAYVDGLCPLDTIINALDLVARNVTDPKLTYSKLETRSVKLANFPWKELVKQQHALSLAIFRQMAQSGSCLEVLRQLKGIVWDHRSAPGPQARYSKRAA